MERHKLQNRPGDAKVIYERIDTRKERASNGIFFSDGVDTDGNSNVGNGRGPF